MKKLSLIVFFTVVLVGYALADIPPVIPNTYVQDHADVLSQEDEASIQVLLDSLKDKYNLEFGVATVNTTKPQAIEPYSLQMARAYGIGSKEGEKRGMLLLLAIQDRKWRFEISRHMEGVVTDGQSGSIGRGVLVPALKKARDSAGYKEAILLTINALEQVITANIEPEQNTTPASTEVIDNGKIWDALGTVALVGGGLIALGGAVFGFFSIRRRRIAKAKSIMREKEWEAKQLAEALRAEALRKEVEEKQRKEEEERKAHEEWLRSPEGVLETRRIEKEKIRLAKQAEQKRKTQERLDKLEKARYEKWAKSPEGVAELARQKEEKEQRRKEQDKKRKENERRAREEREEDERRARARKEESRRYSSSSYSSSSSSSDSNSSSSGFGGFSGGGDFGGGGSSGNW